MKRISDLLIYFLVISLLIGCKKTTQESKITNEPGSELPKTPGLAQLSKGSASQITGSSAVLEADILSDGGLTITVAGFCVSGEPNPDLTDIIVSTSVIQNHFSVTIGLISGSSYYVRAFATNSKGTAYGEQFSLTTLPSLPIVHTHNTTTITADGLTIEGEVVSGGDFSARGFCWSINHNPSLSDNKTVNGIGTGKFSGTIIGLNSGVTYYIRAYTTNSVGTAYGEEISFRKENFSGPTVSDIDGNLYHTVTIGTQTWLVENLKTTRFRNGDPIPEVKDSIQWHTLTTAAYCNYQNKESFVYTYGRLYNWYAVNDFRKIAPQGWHVPSDAEWTVLTDYLKNNGYGYNGDPSKIAKSMASSSGLFVRAYSDQPGSVAYDQAANNSSGFSAIPAGYRIYEIAGLHFSTTMYMELNTAAVWWCSDDLTSPWIRVISHNSTDVDRRQSGRNPGNSIRCIKD